MSTMTPLSANAAPTQKFSHFLEKHKGQLTAALPKHMNADRMVRLTLTAFSSSKSLQDCDQTSIFAAVVLASQMGLEIGVGGQAYIVPYKKKATFVPGWQGIVDLVSRSGRATVWTGAVFAGDQFDYALGDNPFVKHLPEGEDDPKKLLFTYAVGRVKGSEWPVIEVWSAKRLQRHFDKYNKVGDKHYAYDNWEMYCRKIPLLQVCKYMPKSVELNAALTAEYAAETGRGMTFDGEFVTLTDEPEGDNPGLKDAPSPSSRSGNTGGGSPSHGSNAGSAGQQNQDKGSQASTTQTDGAGQQQGNKSEGTKLISKGQLDSIKMMIAQKGFLESHVLEKFQIAALDKISSSLAIEVQDWLMEQQ